MVFPLSPQNIVFAMAENPTLSWRDQNMVKNRLFKTHFPTKAYLSKVLHQRPSSLKLI